ncbi:MAG: hypothetical protein EAX96_05910 [Candidatus Lokiarchaeota archaeon]|nr:hypothetical protein [Candidatus Lokiarchaeota archaeon]
MGTKLRNLIEPKLVDKQKLKNAKVAIDGTNFLIKYLSIIKRQGKILFGETGEPISHVFGFGYLVVNLLEAKMRPIVSLDGVPDEKKRLVNQHIQQKMTMFWRIYDGNAHIMKEELYRNKYFLFDKIKSDLRVFLSLLGVPCVIAPSEAEAQASNLVKMGVADVVFSEDYDCLLYGATRWIREFHVSDKKVQLINLRDVLKDLGISYVQLVDLALLVGTDIFPGINGIGPKKGIHLIKKYGFFEEVAQALQVELPDNLDQLRGYYLNPPKLTYKPLFGYPNFLMLEEYLRDKMNPIRRDKFLKRLKKAIKEFRMTQKTLC